MDPGQRINALRVSQGLPLGVAASRANLKPTAWQRAELYSDVSSANLARIARALGVTVGYLQGVEEAGTGLRAEPGYRLLVERLEEVWGRNPLVCRELLTIFCQSFKQADAILKREKEAPHP